MDGPSVVQRGVLRKKWSVHIPWLYWPRCSLLYEPWCIPRLRSKIMCKNDFRCWDLQKNRSCLLSLLNGLHGFVLDHGSRDLLYRVLIKVCLWYSSTWRNEKEDGQYSTSKVSDWENHQEKVWRLWRKRRRRQVHNLLLRIRGYWRNCRTCLLSKTYLPYRMHLEMARD